MLKKKMDRMIRVLVSKVGLDGHDRGAKVIAYGLRDIGFEVIFLGIGHTPEQIVITALQEDVGLFVLSGAHLPLIKRVTEGLKETGGEDIAILVGGTIPDEDKTQLKEMGVLEVLTSGIRIDQVAQIINDHAFTRASHKRV